VNEVDGSGIATAVATGAPAPGITAPSGVDRRGVFLTDVIVELGFADPETVEEALEASRLSAQPLERYLLDNGVVDEGRLSLALAERHGLDHADLNSFPVDPEAVRMIDGPTAARYTALPIAFAPDGTLMVAFEDPFDTLGISDIEVMAKSEVRPVVAAGSQIRGLVGQLFGAEPQSARRQPEPKPELEAKIEYKPRTELAPPPPDPPPAPPPPDPEPAASTHAPASEDQDELLTALLGLQDQARQATVLAEAREEERRRWVAQEQELRRELSAARDEKAMLEQRLAEVAAAAETARSAAAEIDRLLSK